MALIEKTIGAAGDYADLAEAEATMTGTNDYVFTILDAAEDVAAVNWNASYTGTCLITVDEGVRHSGTPSQSCARHVYSGVGYGFFIGTTNITVEHLLIERHSPGGNSAVLIVQGGTGAIIRNCVLVADTEPFLNFYTNRDATTIHDCIIIERSKPSGAFPSMYFEYGSTNGKCWRNTVLTVGSTSQSAQYRVGISAVDIRQCLALLGDSASVSTAAYTGTWHASSDANGSNDTSSPGGNSSDSLVTDDLIVSGTVDAEDARLVSRAAMQTLTEGSYLGATIGDVDVEGDTRDSSENYPGADWVAPASTATGRRYPRGHNRNRSGSHV